MKTIISPGGKLGHVLSPLESEILAILWAKGHMRVRDIYLILSKKREVAQSSVAVILDRLYQKKAVLRDIEKGRGGVRYVYRPAGDKAAFERRALDAAVQKLMDRFGQSAVSYFNERFSGK